jgi:uncharacterized membrane protein YeaQ/YmgE (transglycosylase-associated protein family)
MKDPQVGWIAAIIIGGLAGWAAEQFMKSDMGLLMNIVLGIIGAAVASAITGSVAIQATPGTFRFVAGSQGGSYQKYQIKTPYGTLGVRGGLVPAI